jgi:transcriptional regulator with XRE-family HTH domain
LATNLQGDPDVSYASVQPATDAARVPDVRTTFELHEARRTRHPQRRDHLREVVDDPPATVTTETAGARRSTGGRPRGRVLHAETFEALLEARRLRKSAVAAKAGIAPSTLSNLLARRAGASDVVMGRLAEVLDVPPVALFPELAGWAAPPQDPDALRGGRVRVGEPILTNVAVEPENRRANGHTKDDQRTSERRPTRYPLRPLTMVVERSAGRPLAASEIARRLGVDPRSVRRAERSGLAVWQADRWATTLGHHPASVWGADW